MATKKYRIYTVFGVSQTPIQYYKIECEPPTSLEIYKNAAIEEVKFGGDGTVGLFIKCVDELILKIKPACLLKNDKGARIKLKCNGNKYVCEEYWKGQLLWRAILSGILDRNGNDIINPYFKIKSDKSKRKERAEAVLICTEEKADSLIKMLIQNDYFAKNSELNDKMIFVLNGKNPKLCECRLTRKQCRNIMKDIVDQYEYGDQSVLINRTKNLLNKSDGASFDIIKGQLSECNIAILGMGKIRQLWKENSEEKEDMKNKVKGLIKEVWKV